MPDIRFATKFRSADTDDPGLVMEDDGTVWLVNPDGTRTQLPGGGSGNDVVTDDIWNAKGDVAVATGPDAAVALPVGADGEILTADSSEPSGVKWTAPSGGGARVSGIQYGPDLITGDSQDFAGGVGGWTTSGGGSLTSAVSSKWHPYSSSLQELEFAPGAPGESIELTVTGSFLQTSLYGIFLLLDPPTDGTTLPPQEVILSIGSAPFTTTFNVLNTGAGLQVLMPIGIVWSPLVNETDPVLSLELVSDDHPLTVRYANVVEILGALPLIGRFDAVVGIPTENVGVVNTEDGVGFTLQGVGGPGGPSVVADLFDWSTHSRIHQFGSGGADFSGTVIGRADPVTKLGLMIQDPTTGDDVFQIDSGEPADMDLPNGAVAMWYDPTNGAPMVKFKGRQSDGTIVTADLPLTP